MDSFINDYDQLTDQDSFPADSSLMGSEELYAEDHLVPPASASLLGVETLPKHTA